MANPKSSSHKRNNKEITEEIVKSGTVDWAKLISTATSLGFSLVGLLYFIGFLVSNIYLRQFGVIDLSLIQGRYLVAGVLLLSCLSICLIPELVFTYQRRILKIRVRLWRTTVYFTSILSLTIVMIFILRDNYLFKINWSDTLRALIPFIVLLIGIDIVSRLWHGWWWGRIVNGKVKFTIAQIRPVRSGFGVGVLLIILLFSGFAFIYLFSTTTYPLIKPEFGGASPQLVQFYGNTHEFKELPLYGISITTTVYTNATMTKTVSDETFTTPLYLLGETSTCYIVTETISTPQFAIRGGTKSSVAYQIRKDILAGVLYIPDN